MRRRNLVFPSSNDAGVSTVRRNPELRLLEIVPFQLGLAEYHNAVRVDSAPFTTGLSCVRCLLRFIDNPRAVIEAMSIKI